MKKKNFKNNNNEVFVTFWWVIDMYRNYVPIAIRCKDYENAREVASDVYSLLGVHYLYINENGKLRCDSMVTTSDEYLSNKCDFGKMYKEYWEKCSNVNNLWENTRILE